MGWDPYKVLGIPGTATVEDAKKAYRKAAAAWHPDRHPPSEKERVEAQFKTVKAAWESIEAGWKPKPEPESAPKSSAGDTRRKPSWHSEKPQAGKPAPGYEAQGRPPPMSRSVRDEVTIEITEKQGFEGCVVPFLHQGKVLHHVIRAGTVQDMVSKELFNKEEMIGQNWHQQFTIKVNVRITRQKPKVEPQGFAHHRVTLPVCAIGLFIGGKINTHDFLGQPVSVHIPAGYNPTEPIVIKERGYGNTQVGRGDLIVTIEPVFKSPLDLNSGELRQLQRLNEMARTK